MCTRWRRVRVPQALPRSVRRAATHHGPVFVRRPRAVDLVDKKTNVVRIDLGKQQDTTYEPKILLPTQFPDQLATNPDKVMQSK